jgi:hypothetical protein
MGTGFAHPARVLYLIEPSYLSQKNFSDLCGLFIFISGLTDNHGSSKI